MMTEDRRDILAELHGLSELAPDMRFGQLIVNLSHLALGATDSATWDVEDDDMLTAIRRLTRQLAERESAAMALQSAGPS